MEILGGPIFGVAGGGESHGPGVSTIVFGCPPGILIRRSEIQGFLDRRRPGSSKLGTPRRETDRVLLLSGIFQEELEPLLKGPPLSVNDDSVPTYDEGFSTGEPISALVLTAGSKSQHYEQFAGPRGEVRPGHTDLLKYHQSRGFTDYRGGGRSSYRSTISDVVGGSIARIFLREAFGTDFLSAVTRVGDLETGHFLETKLGFLESGENVAERLQQIREQLAKNSVPTLDPKFARVASDLIQEVRKQGDSIGAQLEVVAVSPPPLVGEPLYNSLKVRLMGCLGGLHAVQACEVGAGNEVVSRQGSENNDPIRREGYQRNSHGGLIGGITTGSPIVCRVSFKPTSSISKTQQSVRKDLEEIDFRLQKGRHDPCVGIRAGVTLESRMAIELANAVLMRQAGSLHVEDFNLFQ